MGTLTFGKDSPTCLGWCVNIGLCPSWLIKHLKTKVNDSDNDYVIELDRINQVLNVLN